MISRHHPEILGLGETGCSGEHANKICDQLGFEFWIRVEALGFSEGIWLFWKESVQIEILKTHPLFIHAIVKRQGT